MKKLLLTLITMTIALSATACFDQKRPDGMPKLAPVSVCILQEGTPVPDAAVSFIPDDPSMQKWSPGANTDASGIAELRTLGYKGAAVGSYKVTVQKAEIEKKTEGTGPVAQTTGKYYHCVESKFGDAATTPLTIEVTEKNALQTFDVGKAIRVEFTPQMR